RGEPEGLPGDAGCHCGVHRDRDRHQPGGGPLVRRPRPAHQEVAVAHAIEDESRPASAWQVAAAAGAAPATRRRAARRFGPLLAIGFIAFLALLAVLAPFVAPYDPIKQDLGNAVAGPSLQHLLGTDEYGRDVLSRLIWGTRPALLGVLVAIAVASA